MLFDDVDRKNAIKQAARGYYFYEWLSAVAIYEATGYQSLIGKYAARSHEAKWRKFVDIAPRSVIALLTEDRRHGKTQGPDLFVYRPDKSDWFFVEAKGPTDRLRPPQAKLFGELERASGRAIRLARFHWLRTGRDKGS